MLRSSTADFERRREEMVDRDIAGRGVTDAAVLRSMREVPRDKFVPSRLRKMAYSDSPLPIGQGQTISQPYIVAAMAEAAGLDATSRVLEIGAGSGYGAAVLSRIAAEVWSIERIERLATRAAGVLADLGYDNAHVIVGDGTVGLAEEAPFDAIVVTAASVIVPEVLVEQLADGGSLVMPVGEQAEPQRLMRLTRRGDAVGEEQLGVVRFVPLISDE